MGPKSALRHPKRTTGNLIRWARQRPGDLQDRVQSQDRAEVGTVDDGVVPPGLQEPFATAEYDVLPRGQFDFVRRDYYSPLPDLSALPPGFWERKSEVLGLDLEVDAGMAFIERDLAPYVAELDLPRDSPSRPGVFYLKNGCFESVDAELLYAMVRYSRPKTVIELGSGYSSLLINMAARRNATEAVSTRHYAYDPYPRPQVIGDALVQPTSLEPVSAIDVPLDKFEKLATGDVLFVDTTHTVKLGSDVNHIILEILPRLRPGVLVHFHDIFLPWEYPRDWFEKMGYYWAEQYLLQAFLAFNRAFEVVLPAQAVSRTHPDRLASVIPSFAFGASPASLWLRKHSGTGQFD